MTAGHEEQPSWGEDRSIGYGVRRTPTELLAVLGEKVDRIDRDLQLMRSEIERGRVDLREEVRGRLREADERQAERDRVLTKSVEDLDKRMVDKGRYALVEGSLFGLIGMIVVAVLYGMIHWVIALPPVPPLGGHP